jgi:predicted PurR-regulated permease PerM
MSEPSRVELHIPTSTILKVLLTVFLSWVVMTLWPELIFIAISVLLAVALEPLVVWLNDRGVPRGVSVALLAILLVTALGVLVGFVLPPLISQLGELVTNLPHLRDEVLAGLRPGDSFSRHFIQRLFALPTTPQVEAQLSKLLVWGEATVSGIISTLLVLVIALYLLLDGRRLYAWLLAYVPRLHRKRVADTIPEVTKVIYAFVRGQAVVSAAFAVYTASVLAALGVPAVVPLALLAAACDILPVVGVILAIVPAAALALTVSPMAALAVVALYLAYHMFEVYFLVPRLYGSTLRLSTLTVLLALLVGGTLQGIVGALLVLPVVAAYPIIERIWLREYLAADVLADHRALQRAMESGRTTAIDAVLQGEQHAGERDPSGKVDLPGKPPRGSR